MSDRTWLGIVLAVAVVGGGFGISMITRPAIHALANNCLSTRDSATVTNRCDYTIAARICRGPVGVEANCQVLEVAPSETVTAVVPDGDGSSITGFACRVPYVPALVRNANNSSTFDMGCALPKDS